MATSRAQNTQTLLPNGKVLVTGGSNLQAPYGDEMLVPINESEVYDPASNIWSSAGAMSTARALHTATLLNNGKVLVVGGTTDGSTITDNVDIYDPSTNSWAPAAPLNTARQQHTATLLSDGRVLVAGGVPTVYTPLASAEIYDPVANTWTNVASMNDARSQHAAILLPSGHVLVATGYGGNAFLSSAELYDPGSNTWTRTGSLDVEARARAATLLPSGKVLLSGGLDENVGELTTIAIYDPSTGNWTGGAVDTVVLAPEPAVLLPNGKVLVAGLYGGSGVYDPVADSWTTGATMTFDVIQIEPGGGLLTLLPNGKVLAAGGESNFAELYTPAGPPIAGAVTTTVAFDSSNDTITPNLSGGTTFIVSVATQPAHGKAAASGTSLTYTPNAGYAGPDSFTYVAENGDGSSLPATVSLTVSAPTIGLAPTTIPVPQVGAPYSTSVTAAGGTAPYHFLVSGGAVPAGLALNGSTGAISGTPTAGGNASFKVTATDSSVGSGPFSGSQTYLVTVSPPNIGISPATLPNVQQGGAYSETITASGGTAPYRFTVSSGALPGGLVLDPSSGVISGTPSAGATASFTVAVSDSSSGTGPFVATRTYTLLVQGPVPTPPAAGPLSATTACDTPASINLALGISGAAVTQVAIAGAPGHGTVQLNGEVALYTPNSGYCNAPDSFTYTATNAAGTSAPGTVTISIGSPASGTAKVYIANFGDSTVSVIDTGTGAVTATIQAGTQPDAVVVTPDGAKAYVGNFGTNQVTVFTTAANTVTKAISAGNAPYGMAMSPDGSHVYVANSGGHSVSVIDTATDSVTNTIAVGGGSNLSAPWGLAVSPDSQTIYLADNGLSQIDVIDAASGTVTIPTGSIPYAVAFSPDGSRAYVANNQDSTVSVISTAARANIATIAVGPAPMELAVSPDGSTRYVDNSNEFKNPDTGSVTIISTATDSVIATVPVGLSPDGLAVTPDGSLVYVINTDSNSVSVIATATNAVVSAIPVGKFPHGRGIFMGPGSSGSGANTLAASVLPGGRSVEVGTPATIFATLLNAGTTTADTCGVALAAGAPSGLSLAYQTTNPATNAPTGQSNSPVSIVAGGYQTFLLTFASGTPLSVTQQPLDFSCSNAAPAPSTPGVDTIDLTFSSTPITDMVALAATHDGTLHLTQGQPGAFAVATINLGAAGGLIASADTGSAALPISLSLCETNPSTGQCLSAPAASASVSVGQNATPTFSIFATTAGPIAFAPGTSRIFVLFKDAAGAAHGSTSVAVVTQ